MFVIFEIFLNQSEKERKPMMTHQHANLLVIVASHISLAITSPWFKSFSKYDPYVNSSHPNSTKQEQATLKPSKLNKSNHGVK